MKKLLILVFLLMPGMMLCAQDNQQRRGGDRRPGQSREMRFNFSPESMAKMEADAINEAVGLDSLQYQLVYILKYSDVVAMQDSMKARTARMEKAREKGEFKAPKRDEKSREEWMKAREELMKKRRDAMNEQMKQILSAKQYKKYLKFEEERAKKRRPQPGQGMGMPRKEKNRK